MVGQRRGGVGQQGGITAVQRGRAGADITDNVAAGRQRGQQFGVHALHEPSQAGLRNRMKLHALTGCEA